MLNKYGVRVSGFNKATGKLEFSRVYFEQRREADRARRFLKMLRNRSGYSKSLDWTINAVKRASTISRIDEEMYYDLILH